MHALLAVDPGLQGTGLAFWRDARLLTPTWVDVSRPKANADWVLRAESIALYVAMQLRPHQAREIHFACELMEMHGSARARMMWHGDLQRTLVLIGMMTAIVRRDAPVTETRLVTPSEWKGQLPKSVVERRIRRTLGHEVCAELNIRSHAWDAVGIGLWVKGQF